MSGMESTWGTEPAFSITPPMIESAGGREGLRFTREVLTVYDFDGDGRTEIVPHGGAPYKDGYRDVIILRS